MKSISHVRRMASRTLLFAVGFVSATALASEPSAEPPSNGQKGAPLPASLAHSSTTPNAVLHFADLGGIQDWKALKDKRLLIEGTNHRYYVATFFGACPDLRFADTIAFITDASGDLTKFDSILVHGRRCQFRTFEALERDVAEALRKSG